MYATLNTIATKLLPAWMYDRLIRRWSREGLKKYFQNTGWLFVGRVISFLTSFFTIIYVARYLGPENLGKLSYAQSIIAILSMFASLGIDQIVYRDLVAHPEREKEILGTAIVAKLFFGFLTFMGAVAIALTIHTEPILTWLVAIVALSFIFQPFSVIGNIFSARVQSKYTATINVTISILIPVLKFLVIFLHKGILYFAAIIAFEALLISTLSVFLYKKIYKGSLSNLSASWNTFTRLIQDSWPLLFLGVASYLYVRIDQVMIQHFIDSSAVGLYEAAVRLTEPLGFLPGIVVASVLPALVHTRKTDPSEYRKRLQALTAVCIGISVTLAGIIFLLAPILIQLIYGPAYIAAIPILQIYVWSNVGTVAAMLIFNYLIIENKIHLQILYSGTGAILNIILNSILIPTLGVTGAAYATLITVTVVVGTFLLHKKVLS